MKSEEAFGKVLKELRRKKGYSQEQLALASDLDRTFISLLERGKRQPSLNSIIKISECLGIPAHKVVELTTRQIGKNSA